MISSVLLGLFACTGGEPEVRPVAGGARLPANGTSTAEECNHGPWALHCPEAYWARAVVAETGLRLAGNTGSALVLDLGRGEVYFWAFEVEEPFRKMIAGENYRRLRTIHETPLYTDGVRITWAIQGLAVWLEGRHVSLKKLVTATRRIPYPLPGT